MAIDRHLSAVLAACVLWGTTGTVAHFAPAGSSHTLIGLSTFGFGGLLLLALDWRATSALFRRRDQWGWLLLGAVGVVLYASMYYASMKLIGVAIGNALALGSGPVFAAVLELLIDRTRVTRRWLFATGLAVVGIALVGVSAHSTASGSPVLGVLLALAAGFGYALYSYVGAVLIRRGAQSQSAMAAMFSLAAVVLLPWFVVAGPGPLLSASGALVLAYLAIAPMALAYLFFGYGLRGLSASTATTLALTEPIVATVLAVLVVGERPSLTAWLGLGLIFIGVAIVAWQPGGRRV